MSQQELSSKEQKVLAYLTDYLSGEFNIPVGDISATVDRDVIGIMGGSEVKRDIIKINVEHSVLGDKGDPIMSLPVQHKLVDELGKIWSSSGRPLVTIDIPYPERVVEEAEETEVNPPS